MALSSFVVASSAAMMSCAAARMRSSLLRASESARSMAGEVTTNVVDVPPERFGHGGGGVGVGLGMEIIRFGLKGRAALTLPESGSIRRRSGLVHGAGPGEFIP